MKGHRAPRHFDRNLVVIGAGTAGLVSALVATKTGAAVTLVETNEMGGDCLNTGCVPSKALIHMAKLASETRKAAVLGLISAGAEVDTRAAFQHVQRSIQEIAPHDSAQRYREMGVDVRFGRAKVTSPWTVEIDGTAISTRAIIIATGASPVEPEISGLAGGYLTSETVWGLEQAPRQLIIIGGGPIGCELSQAFGRLGTQVTLIQSPGRLLTREDDEVSDLAESVLTGEGVRVMTGARLLSCETLDGARTLVVTSEKGTARIPFTEILVAVGRKPRTGGIGLEDVDVQLTSSERIRTNDYLQTSIPTIYACGDVTGPWQFTHSAAVQGAYAGLNAVFRPFWSMKARTKFMPSVTFMDPEIGTIGINEQQARSRGIPFEVTRYDLRELDRAIVDGATEGFVKVLTEPGSDRILGASVVAPRAGELLAELALAMRYKLGLKAIFGLIHAYPTYAEANREVARAWRVAHLPRNLLPLLGIFHRWRRG